LVFEDFFEKNMIGQIQIKFILEWNKPLPFQGLLGATKRFFSEELGRS
jgi:hypothetical protein